MRRKLLILLLALTALTVFGITLQAVGSMYRVDGPTYSLAQVEVGLKRQPGAWLGRTIRISDYALAVSGPCTSSMAPCGTSYLLLGFPTGPTPPVAIPTPLPTVNPNVTARSSMQAQGAGHAIAGFYYFDSSPAYINLSGLSLLPIHPEPDQLLDQLRRLPLVGRLLPGPQAISGGRTLRATIRSAPTSVWCSNGPCYEAVLPDAG